MGQAPTKCPPVWRKRELEAYGFLKKDFSFEKAFVGAVLIGKVGVLTGFLEKHTHCYYCGKWGFKYEYDA